MKEAQLQDLLKEMTLEEKLGQLSQITGEHYVGNMSEEMVETGPKADDLGLTKENLYMIGSVIGSSSAKVTNLIQANYLEKSRLKIPLLFMHDAIHGYKTIFPIPLALSCSWNEALLEKVASVTATELRAAGIHVNFSPMTDIARDARWGRVMESFGEDHLLSGNLGKAMIQGYQKTTDSSIPRNGVAACLKHFAAYGAVDAGKDYASVDLSMREFFGYYARPYEIALEAKPRFVMSSFNSINGEPVTGSQYFLDEVLRQKFGFNDLIISDWGSVVELKNHGTVANDFEAAADALSAGIDIEMISTTYLHHGQEIVSENNEFECKINESVMRVLGLKNDMGLFENPYTDETSEAQILLSNEAKQFAKQAAKESCVLLKNENILPFNQDTKQILLVGPFAKTNELLGNWACKGEFKDTTSIKDGIQNLLPNATVHAYVTIEECPSEIINTTDIIVATIGEHFDLSGEGHSSTNLELPLEQHQLVQKIQALDKPTTYIGFGGRPLALSSVIENIEALLWCWYPGTSGGDAIAELLFGLDTPSGKLTMSFPRVTGQVPIRYNEYRSGKPANDSSYSSRYQDCEVGPLFPLGHGLSYARIRYENLKLSSEILTDHEAITLSVDIINDSPYDYKEIVILYMEDPVSKLVRPVRELINYQTVHLPKGEMQTIHFKLTVDDFKYLNTKLEKTLEPGQINLYLNQFENKVFEVQYVNRA